MRCVMKFKGLLVVCCLVFICACSSKNKDYSENQTGQFIDVKEKNKVVQATKMIVLEKFTADSCPPCKDIAEAYSNLFKNEGLGDHAIMLSYQLNDHIFNSLDKDTQSFFSRIMVKMNSSFEKKMHITYRQFPDSQSEMINENKKIIGIWMGKGQCHGKSNSIWDRLNEKHGSV